MVIQRSRSYAKNYFDKKGTNGFFFPERDVPKVADYKLAKIYGELFAKVKKSFNKKDPFLELKLYNPENYKKSEDKKNPMDKWT